jgi:UDP-glucose/iron transport system ATP-binding protein
MHPNSVLTCSGFIISRLVFVLRVSSLHILSLKLRDFDLPAGEAVAVTGASGAGKSLVLRAISDLIPNQGEVVLEDQNRDGMSGPEWRRLVTYVAATPGWWEERVQDHFSDLVQAKELAAEFLLPQDIFTNPVAQLSTGEQQRLVLIRAMVQRPKVLLLDEPTSGLDAHATATVEKRLEVFLQDGGSLLFVTHDGEQAKRLARRALHINNNLIEEQSLWD